MEKRIIYLYEDSGYITGYSNTVQPNMHQVVFDDDGTFNFSFPMWKLVDGTLVKDEENYTEPMPEPNQQEQINIELTEQLSQTKSELETANAGIVALTKMVAELKGAQA